MKNTEIVYFGYCRKSSESEDRQVASIEDQKRELREYAVREGIEMLEIFEESQSAYKIGRPMFGEMMNRIQNGEAQSILVWHVNRLARNPVDGGLLIYSMDENSLREIRTPEKTFRKTSDDLFMLGLNFGMAKKDSDDKGSAVKRGFKGKLNRGWRPGPAPIGYRNIGDVGDKTIIADPERFDLVRKMWDLFLTGTVSVSKILDIATNEWGLRTTQKKRLGGRPLTMSHMYAIFNKPFYYGYFDWRNPETGEKELYKGEHPAMITEDEFNRGQILLGKKGKAQPKTREFAFTGLMHCGECGSMITAEEVHQIICSECKNKFSSRHTTTCPKCKTDVLQMSNPKILKYVYYHCTKKKNPHCSQKSVRIEDFEKQFDTILGDVTIDDDYLRLALDYLKDRQGLEVNDETTITKSLQEAFNNCQTRINNLHKEYTSPQNADHSMYSPEEFKRYKGDLLKERLDLEQKLGGSKARIDRTNELSERTFNLCHIARYHFNNGTLQKKKDIFANIGSNLTLIDQKLSIEALEPYMLIEREIKAQKEIYNALEREKMPILQRRKEAFATSSPSWLRTVEAVRTWISLNQATFYVPTLVA
jgi:DNA invertase Pin-like site-specific DNA recombinase